jgi:hypothetical protein
MKFGAMNADCGVDGGSGQHSAFRTQHSALVLRV